VECFNQFGAMPSKPFGIRNAAPNFGWF
jgi:hypothetical protein